MCYPEVIYNRRPRGEKKGVSECGKIAEGRQYPIWKDHERSVNLFGIRSSIMSMNIFGAEVRRHRV